MAPGKNERHPSHTGTIPKIKVRNNCNVPQEAVTPTRRDMTSNLVSTSLDWVPVSEYNSRQNYSESRKQPNTSDHDLTDLDNSITFESGIGRFVPVRPQPRALPLPAQAAHNAADHHHHERDDAASHTLHPYGHHAQNSLTSQTNHATAAVMIVNPTTPNACNISQQFNVSNQNRNNLTRSLQAARNSGPSNSVPVPMTTSRPSGKAVNLINNMYEQAQANYNNFNENDQMNRESAAALGEAMVSACPDAAAVERRLGQIREYIRVTSSLVDTMRNSEDEAFIEHTKEEYDELVQMVMKLKESESKLQKILDDNKTDNLETDLEDTDKVIEIQEITITDNNNNDCDENVNHDNTSIVKVNNNSLSTNNLKKVTNVENELLNVHSRVIDEILPQMKTVEAPLAANIQESSNEGNICKPTNEPDTTLVINNADINSFSDQTIKKDNQQLNEILRKNILSCVEKVARIEEMRNKNDSTSCDPEKACVDEINKTDSIGCDVTKAPHIEEMTDKDTFGSADQSQQEVVIRPVSVQSNGSAYSENELWQNEIKSKMELSHLRLSALKQQQKRLLKYQEEAKQQLDEIDRQRQPQEGHSSTSQDNVSTAQNHVNSNYLQPSRVYTGNQVGVATTLPQNVDGTHSAVHHVPNNMDHDHGHLGDTAHNQDRRYSRANVASGEEGTVGQYSDVEEDEALLNEHSRALQLKLHELQLKKQHMENLVTEFQKLQMAARVQSSHNTYSSSGEDSGDEQSARKCNKSAGSIKNEDPFKLMEIKAIKAALQKTKDLMRSVETFESNHLPSGPEDSFQILGHSNIHDNKSDGGGSGGGWSTEGSASRVRNALPPRRKLTNERHSHQQQQARNQEANIASLQELAQELRLETEKIMNERARIKDISSNKDTSRNQKKVNQEVCTGNGAGAGCTRANDAASATNGVPGPAERRQMQLRALLAEKQRELEALLNKEKIFSVAPESHVKRGSSTVSVVNQSYNSDHEPDSRSEHNLVDSQTSREEDNFEASAGGGSRAGDNIGGEGAGLIHSAPAHLTGAYASDSDSASRSRWGAGARGRSVRRRPTHDAVEDNDIHQTNNSNQNIQRVESRGEAPQPGPIPLASLISDISSTGMLPQPHLPPSSWSAGTKSNQDVRSNQFTQNSHSQTMERLLGTPQMSYPPSMPFNMMMPYGMVGGCPCGCAIWGAWCWQQLAMQQRELHALREQLGHLEERWRAETATHTLNNQVPPGNRANNYWDNFRSYSRQNLLSTNSKANADTHSAAVLNHNPHPLMERSHNTLHHSSTSTPSNTPKRNTNAVQSTSGIPSVSTTVFTSSAHCNNEEVPSRHSRRNVAYERSLSFSSAPDVLNINQNIDAESSLHLHIRHLDDANISNVNINRQESTPNSFRNLNITNPIPEIIQSHSNNLNTPVNSKKKSSSKLPAKNSTNKRDTALGYSQTSNINIASTSEAPNPNLASTSRDMHEKATSKLFDLLRENVYSEVTALIGVNESHPDFLIQLFRELQLISSDPLRQKVLQSIRNVLSQYSTIVEGQTHEAGATSADGNSCQDCSSISSQNAGTNTLQVDNSIVHFLLQRCEEICTPALLEALAGHILGTSECRQIQSKKLMELLSKYEGMRVSDVSSDIIDNLAGVLTVNEGDESTQLTSELSESSILQDVAGSLNLFSSSDPQLHQLNACPYDMWAVHVEGGQELGERASPRSSHDGKVDLINCSEMHNGDLAEADQTCHSEVDNVGSLDEAAAAAAEGLPDVVDTEEVTPTEAEAEWLGLDRVPTRLHMEETPGKQKD